MQGNRIQRVDIDVLQERMEAAIPLSVIRTINDKLYHAASIGDGSYTTTVIENESDFDDNVIKFRYAIIIYYERRGIHTEFSLSNDYTIINQNNDKDVYEITFSWSYTNWRNPKVSKL